MALRTISVGIDGSAPAASGCAWAAGLAEETGAMLRVLHVWQTPSSCAFPAAPSAEEALQHARKVVSEAIETANGPQSFESVIIRGAPGPSLVDGAQDSDLLVVGRVGEGLVEFKPLFGELLGASTARYCAHHSTVPVATITADAVWVDSPQVIIGIDGSAASLEALRWATEQLPSNATLHAIQAVSLPCADLGAPAEYELLDPVVAEHRADLRRLVDSNVHDSFRTAGRSVQVHVVLGYAEDGLINPGFAYDMIIVGQHGKASTSLGVLGSVAEHTCRHATVPIVIVPAPR